MQKNEGENQCYMKTQMRQPIEVKLTKIKDGCKYMNNSMQIFQICEPKNDELS